MRSQCRSKRAGKAVPRRWTHTARIEVARIAALAVALGLGSGCTRTGVSQTSKSGAAPAPTTWYAPLPPRILPTVDAGTTQEPADAGSAVTPTPVSSTPDSGVPSSPADAGPSDPIVVEPPPVIAPTATLIFNESPSTYTASPAPQQFSVRSVRELFIHSVWSGLTGEHSEIRKFYSPSGELYYQKLTPFSTDIDAPVPFERQVSFPHATSVQATPLDANGNVIVSDYLSIAGTWISDRAMTGIWTLEVYLDDATAPSVSSDLELVP